MFIVHQHDMNNPPIPHLPLLRLSHLNQQRKGSISFCHQDGELIRIYLCFPALLSGGHCRSQFPPACRTPTSAPAKPGCFPSSRGPDAPLQPSPPLLHPEVVQPRKKL
ncbi:hypothetical protein BJV74DRAFT_29183 [Russula compacta]|nr:hypothetical protein BJV74DRAFT_29183 [Russula compacta]